LKYAICIAEDISLGVGYIAAYLEEQGHQVKLFFDARQFARGYARHRLLSKVLDLMNYNIRKIKQYDPDVCLFSCVTAHYKWALQMAERVKKEVGCVIIFGGAHATLVPDEVRSHTFIDEVVVGDGVKHFGGVFNPDKLWPDREMFFNELPSFHRKYQLFMTSFGCPYTCTYCSNEELRKAYTTKMIRRSPQGCIKELAYLKRTGMEYVLFVDDIFICDKGFLRKFLQLYKDIIKLPFTCFVHPKFVDKETVTLLKEAGCQMAWMGIQTAVEQLRKEILNRPETNDEIKRACALIKEAGIKLMIDHIFGIPFESEVSNDYSRVFYTDLKPDVVNCYNLLYFPKAKIIEHAIRFGYLTTLDVPKINRGETLQYHTGDRGGKFYDTYHKTMVTTPLGEITWELLPTILVKLIVHIRAGRWWMPFVMIQNEIYFTWKAILKKVRIL